MSGDIFEAVLLAQINAAKTGEARSDAPFLKRQSDDLLQDIRREKDERAEVAAQRNAFRDLERAIVRELQAEENGGVNSRRLSAVSEDGLKLRKKFLKKSALEYLQRLGMPSLTMLPSNSEVLIDQAISLQAMAIARIKRDAQKTKKNQPK